MLFAFTGFSQTRFSLATDFSTQRNFKKGQQYFAIGQTVSGHFSFTAKDGAYASFCYYTDGKFSNQLTATAKSIVSIPQQIAYTNKASMTFRHISLGLKHYIKGAYDAEKKWNLYGLAGFGLLMGRVENIHSVVIDTSAYKLPVLAGKANFKRLTLDLGAGVEFPVGGDFYLYTEGKVFIPTTDRPSDHLYSNAKAPFPVFLNIGFRILFD